MLNALTAGQTQGRPQTKTKQFSGLKVGKRIALLLFLLSCKQIQIGKTKKYILKKLIALSLVSSLKVQKAETSSFEQETSSFEQEIGWKTLQEKYVPYFISMTTNVGQTTNNLKSYKQASFSWLYIRSKLKPLVNQTSKTIF